MAASRIVTRRQFTASSVEAAAAEHAVEAAENVSARLAAFAEEGAPPIDFVALQSLFARALRADREAMEAADKAHVEELRDDIEPRERRDVAVEALYQRVAQLRANVETVFGAGASNKLFAIRGLTSRNPEVLRRQAESILDRLRDESHPLPAPQARGMAVEPAVWAADLEPAHTELVAALRAVYTDRRRAETTLRRKQEALDEYNRTYAVVTSLLSAIYRYARLDAYDERLRPTVPQSSTVPEEPPVDQPLPDGGEGEQQGPAPPLQFPQAGGTSGDGEATGEPASTASITRSAA